MSVSDIEKEKRTYRKRTPKPSQPLCICARPGECQVVMDSRRCRKRHKCGCGSPGRVEDMYGDILCDLCLASQEQVEKRCSENGIN